MKKTIIALTVTLMSSSVYAQDRELAQANWWNKVKNSAGTGLEHVGSKIGVGLEYIRSTIESEANAKDRQYGPLLWDAVQKSDLAGVKEALAKGANPNSLYKVESCIGNSRCWKRWEAPLHRAALNNNTDIIDELIKAGADVDREDSKEWTPLEVAFDEDKVESVLALVQAGASLYSPNKGLLSSPDDELLVSPERLFDFAIEHNSIPLAVLVLKHGVNSNYVQRALANAAGSENLAAFQSLLTQK